MENKFTPKKNIIGGIGKIKEKSFFEKAKEYKMEIAIGSAILISVVGVVIVMKNRDSFKTLINSSLVEEVLIGNQLDLGISEYVSKGLVSNLPIGSIDVREHIRNLPEGWKPSINKIELAEKMGHCLEENQTLVNAYTKIVS